MLPTPYLVAGTLFIGLPMVYLAVRYRDFRKFLAGAFFVSSAYQFSYYMAHASIENWPTKSIQPPEVSGVRAVLHFVIFLICLYFGFFSRKRPAA